MMMSEYRSNKGMRDMPGMTELRESGTGIEIGMGTATGEPNGKQAGAEEATAVMGSC